MADHLITFMDESVQARFWTKVDKSAGADGCWLWRSTLTSGYGAFKIMGKNVKAHRLSFFAHNGFLPEGMEICHSCDNPPCVNPAHLWAGSRSDNQRDSFIKGRNHPPVCKSEKKARGEKNGWSILTGKDVIRIRTLGEPSSLLARELGVSRVTINRVRRNAGWAHV